MAPPALYPHLLQLSRQELYGLMQSARDLPELGGNNDGRMNEKGGPSVPGPGIITTGEAFFRVGFSKKDEATFLSSLVERKVATEWKGQALTTVGPEELDRWANYAVRKALDLTRFGRSPNEVSEGFVSAKGSVGEHRETAEPITDREVFFQRWRPPANVPRSGKLIVLSPGFQETGRHFLEQIDAMNKRGHEVIVLDHQWAGHTKGGSAGGIDRLFGAARDVAAVAAYAATLLQNDPTLSGHPDKEVVLFGNSMGAAAALAAATLTDRKMLHLDGPPMPTGLRMVLQAPYLGASPKLANRAVTALGHLPMINQAKLSDAGLIILSTEPDAVDQHKREALVERIVAQPSAMVSPKRDLATLKALIQAGRGPTGSALIVHAKGDRLADYAGASWLDKQLGTGSELVTIEGKNHVLEQSKKEQHFALDGLERLLKNQLRPTFGGEEIDNPPASVEEWLKAAAARIKEQAAQKLVDSAGEIGWLLAKPPPTTDVSAEFKQIHASLRASGESPLPKEAADHVYLLVPGLFTERYPGYLGDNLQRLKERGLDAKTVSIDTDASVLANAKAVRDAVLEASAKGKQVVLLGHSKGGVDLSAALSLYPELKPLVRAVVMMQSPIGGTPIASDIEKCPELRPLVHRLIRGLFRGDPAALADLSYSARRAFIEKHPYPGDIPTVCLASSTKSPLSLTAASSGYLRQRYGADSDGLVVVKDAVHPGARVVTLDDLDHAGPAMRGPDGLCTYRPADLTEALIALALKTGT